MLTWTPSLAIGVAEIDAQHKTLFERAGRSEAAVIAREPYERLEELFAFPAFAWGPSRPVTRACHRIHGPATGLRGPGRDGRRQFDAWYDVEQSGRQP
jgi:hypothetical protein